MGNALYLEFDVFSDDDEEEHAADMSAGLNQHIARPNTLLGMEEQLQRVLQLLCADITRAINLQRHDPHQSAVTQEEQMRLLDAILERATRLMEEIDFQEYSD